MYKDVVLLAEEVEKWAIRLRYKDNKINENIKLSKIYYLNKISTESIVVSNALHQIKDFLLDLEKVEEIPEEIRNKLLLLKAFYVEPKGLETPLGTLSSTYNWEDINN